MPYRGIIFNLGKSPTDGYKSILSLFVVGMESHWKSVLMKNIYRSSCPTTMNTNYATIFSDNPGLYITYLTVKRLVAVFL